MPLALLIVSILAGSVLHAQPPVALLPAGPPPGPGVPGPENRMGLRGPQDQGLTPLTILSGTVQQLTGNDDGVLDGFTLKTSAATVAVQFPPHLGQSVHAAVKPGSQVSVSGFSEPTPAGQPVFRLTQLTAGKTVIMETPPAAPAVLPTPTLTTLKGSVADYQLDREGRANGLILSDQTLVKVPPHLAGQLVSMVPKGSTVAIDGYVQPAAEGQFMLQKRTIIQPTVVTVNGQSFLVR